MKLTLEQRADKIADKFSTDMFMQSEVTVRNAYSLEKAIKKTLLKHLAV
jgi:hypothetical protein